MHSQLRYICSRDTDQRSWFNSPDADLYLWYQGQTIQKFEFCYNKGWHEQSIRWQAQQACKKMCVDDGESAARHKQACILTACGQPNWQAAARAFRLASENLPLTLRHFILNILTKELVQIAPIKTTIRT